MRKFAIVVTVVFSVASVCGALGFAAGMSSMEDDFKPTASVKLAVYRADGNPAARKIAYKMYEVKKDDSIYSIAAKHLVLQWQLRVANGIEEDAIIHPGDKIKIPVINWASKSYEGKASWYGPGFHGKRMANGRVYDQNKILVAHRTLPLGMRVRITNLHNNKSIVTKILDRGPYTKKNGKYDREIDLSYGAAKVLGAVQKGVVPVKIELLG